MVNNFTLWLAQVLCVGRGGLICAYHVASLSTGGATISTSPPIKLFFCDRIKATHFFKPYPNLSNCPGDSEGCHWRFSENFWNSQGVE
jgi:hypothetical protein